MFDQEAPPAIVDRICAASCAENQGVATIVYRTDLIEDPAVLARVDAQLAANVARWPSMGRGRLSGAIDRIVVNADRGALRARKQRQVDREIAIGENFGALCRIEGVSTIPAPKTPPSASKI